MPGKTGYPCNQGYGIYKAIQGSSRLYKAIQGSSRLYKAIKGSTRQFKYMQGTQGYTRMKTQR